MTINTETPIKKSESLHSNDSYNMEIITGHESSINRYANDWLKSNPNADIEKMNMTSTGSIFHIAFLYKPKEQEHSNDSYNMEIITGHESSINQYANNWLKSNPNINIEKMNMVDAGEVVAIAFLYKPKDASKN